MIPSIGHLMKGRIKVKGLIKLFAEYTLKSSKGNPLRYDYSQMTVDASEQSGKAVFIVTKESKSVGREKQHTTDFTEVMSAMKAYAPEHTAWELVAKV